jgi:fibronectin-binding autotransporter adhesin
VSFDGFGAPVSLNKGDSLIGRRSRHRISARWRDPARGSVYGIANLYYEFLDGTETNVAGVSFTFATDRLWGGIGSSGSYSWNDSKYALYGEALVSTSFDEFSNSYVYKGTAGFWIRW